eukprot:m.3439 g.3439  ORF g.3439 m.3439 type:complete len:307 (-) comp1418_c0_seq2:126-1046(-)
MAVCNALLACTRPDDQPAPHRARSDQPGSQGKRPILSGCRRRTQIPELCTRLRNDDIALTVAILNGETIQDADISSLSDSLEASNYLDELQLRRCSITTEGLWSLLGSYYLLTTLNLDDTRINDEGAVAVASWLRYSSTVQRLFLRGCGITAAGVQSLAPGLRACATLARLGLAENDIGDEGALILAGCLEDAVPILWLGLYRCNITDVGASSLLDGVSSNPAIEYIDLSGNEIAPHLQKSMIEVLVFPGLRFTRFTEKMVSQPAVRELITRMAKAAPTEHVHRRLWRALADAAEEAYVPREREEY